MRLSPRLFLAALVLLAMPAAHAAKGVPFGGTDHFLYAYGTTDGFGANNGWYLPAQNLRTPIGGYHLDPAKVDAQIAGLAASGQKAYTLVLHNSELGPCEANACNDGVPDGVWGEVIDDSWGAMRPQHRANFKAILGRALDSGMRRIYIRFGYNANPQNWTQWDETRYQKVWNFIVDAHKAAHEVVDAKGLSSLYASPSNLLIFDLGLEDGGLGGGQRPAFMTRLWQDYTYTYGTDDTLGFSIAWAPGRFTALRNLLAATGSVPNKWGVDIYDNLDTGLGQLYAEMGSLRNQPVHLLETYFNRAQTATQAQTALNNNEFLHLALLGQWPTSPGSGHFSRSVVDSLTTATTFSNYTTLLATRRMYFTSGNADVLGVRDIDCTTKPSFPCSVQLRWGAAPGGKHYGIYIRQPAGGHALVHCENTAGTSTILWISTNPNYRFDVYEISAASCASPGPNPGAILRTTAEATPF